MTDPHPDLFEGESTAIATPAPDQEDEFYSEPERGWDQAWLCDCGNYIEDGLHCRCGAEPPWGCPCSGCQDGDVDEDLEENEG